MKTHRADGRPTKRYLRELAFRQRLEWCSAELTEWIARSKERRITRALDPTQWSLADARECAASIREFDEILHRHRFCTDDCLACEALVKAQEGF